MEEEIYLCIILKSIVPTIMQFSMMARKQNLISTKGKWDRASTTLHQSEGFVAEAENSFLKALFISIFCSRVHESNTNLSQT